MRSNDLESLPLTGRTGWRKGLFGRLIITVEVRAPRSCYPRMPPPPGGIAECTTRWRDATLCDLLKLQSCDQNHERKLKPPPVNP